MEQIASGNGKRKRGYLELARKAWERLARAVARRV